MDKEESGSDNSDEEDGSASTTSSEVSRFIDRRDRLTALESELSIELQTEKALETSIARQKQINAKNEGVDNCT